MRLVIIFACPSIIEVLCLVQVLCAKNSKFHPFLAFSISFYSEQLDERSFKNIFADSFKLTEVSLYDWYNQFLSTQMFGKIWHIYIFFTVDFEMVTMNL